jgi:hypothetical protein
LTTLKRALFAPIPNASVNVATKLKPGFFANIHAAYRKSCHRIPMVSPPALFDISRRLRAAQFVGDPMRQKVAGLRLDFVFSSK